VDTLLVDTLSDTLTLDAGSVLETADGVTILPPAIPMIDQLLAYLDGRPQHDHDIQIRHQAVGCTALCVRWGTYLATLTDANAPLHPDLVGRGEQHSQRYSFISDAEMRRLNIEVSANLARLVHLYRERGRFALYALVAKAHSYLPMPQQSVPKDAGATAQIYGALRAGAGILRAAQGETGTAQALPLPRLIPERDADRFLCNVLTAHAWRNTTIEEIHAGTRPAHELQLSQRRCTPATERRLLREVSAKLGSILFAFDDLFDASSPRDGLAAWPQTASAFASTLYSGWATGWSLTEVSSPILLQGTPRSSEEKAKQ
jgi:hypothetical protein